MGGVNTDSFKRQHQFYFVCSSRFQDTTVLKCVKQCSKHVHMIFLALCILWNGTGIFLKFNVQQGFDNIQVLKDMNNELMNL